MGTPSQAQEGQMQATGLMTCDSAGTVIACTSEAVELLDISQQELVGSRFRDLPWRPVDDQGKSIEGGLHPIEQSILRQSQTTGILKHPSKSTVVHIRVSPWLGTQTSGVVCRLSPDRPETVDDEETEIQKYAYTVAHNLKSPLIAVMGHLEFAEEAALQGNFSEMRQELARIDKAAERMNELLEELLHASRPDSPRQGRRVGS